MTNRPRRSPLLRTQIAMLAALTASMQVGCGDVADDGVQATTDVTVLDNQFDPGGNRVEPGQTVTWTWGGNNPHNVTFDDPTLAGSATQTQGSFQQAFPDEGEFTYYCTVHGRGVMSGRVVVGEATGGGTPTGGGY